MSLRKRYEICNNVISIDPLHALGMTSGEIPDQAIKASSSYSDGKTPPSKGRLFRTRYDPFQSWASDTNDANQWLQIDLSRWLFITAVATQGRRFDHQQRVTSYWMSFSNNSLTWNEYQENQIKKVI